MKVVYYPNYTLFNKKDTGKIVLYKNSMETSLDGKTDFQALISKMTSSNGYDDEDVYSKAIKLYFVKEPGILVVFQDKNEDDEPFKRNQDFLLNLIAKKFPR